MAVFGAFYGAAKYDRARTYLSGGGIDRLPKTWSATILDATAYAETLVPEGSVAIAHLQTAFPIEASSLSVVAIPRLFAEVPDMKERKGDNDAFFARGTSIQARCAILRKYDVQLIVWRDIWLEVDVVEELRPFGEIKNYGGLRFLPVAETSFSACNEGP